MSMLIGRIQYLIFSIQDPQAQALLEIAGKQMHSEGFRDAKPILDDDNDEE